MRPPAHRGALVDISEPPITHALSSDHCEVAARSSAAPPPPSAALSTTLAGLSTGMAIGVMPVQYNGSRGVGAAPGVGLAARVGGREA